MGRCCSKEELINLLSKAAAYRDCLMIVEDYVEIEKEYCIVGFCDRDYILIPDVIDELVLGHGEHAGVTCFGRVISPESLDSGFMDSLKRFLHSTGFTGLFTVDVFESKNRLYFGELNLRIGGSGIAVIGAGVNIAYIAAECLQGHTVDEKDKECREMTFVSERPLVNDLVTGHISLKEYRRFLKDADFRFIDSDDDPAPQKVFKWHIARQFARRLLQKSRH